MIPNKITILVNHSIYPVIGTRYSRRNYEHTTKLIEHLIENVPDNPLLEIMCTIIEHYEENAAEFSNFNNMLKTELSQNFIA
jgi:HTH-type transcriptional regulator/antitoxin HigA